MRTKLMDKKATFLTGAVICTSVALLMICPAFASGYTATLQSLLQQIIDIVGKIFVAVGIILLVYSIGALILAFKNEDADSKSRAGTMLVVSVALIALPGIIAGLNLTQYLN